MPNKDDSFLPADSLVCFFLCPDTAEQKRYIPFNAVHNTVSTPKGWNETTIATTAEGSATFALRKTFAGALYLMDEECRLIVDKMKSRHLYDDAIFIMASDNGGSPTDGGNNWPLRGAKKTMFEGGHRVSLGRTAFCAAPKRRWRAGWLAIWAANYCSWHISQH